MISLRFALPMATPDDSAPALLDAAPPVSRARTALSVFLLAVLYLWVFPYHAAVNNPNENVRIYMTVAIVDDHTFAINRIENTWGYVNDKSVKDGKLYSSKAPGTSYLGVPFYWLMTKVTGRSTLPPAPPVVAPTPPGTPPRAPPPAPPPPLDRTKVVYFLRLFSNVLPALLFAWFWHRFLAQRTRSATLREAVFFSTMAGSSLYAYSEVFASHAHNAFCFGAALMAMATLRERDVIARARGDEPRVEAGMMLLAGLFGAGIAMFEYPAGVASAAVALSIVSTAAERRRWLLPVAGAALAVGAGVYLKLHSKPAVLAAAGVAAVAYLATLSGRSVLRLVMAGLGGLIPVGLTMLYHWRCFGDPFKPGYSYLENPTFRAEIAQGFFGATQFSWEAGLRMWFDPAFGLVPCTMIFIASILGMGVYLSWRPEGRWRLVAVRVLLVLAVLFAMVKTALALKANAHLPAHHDVGVWVASLTGTLLALFSVTMPKPARDDRSMGAVMLFACLMLTHVIGMMNNWRGGWQVGPRYLVTIVPALGIAALAGLDALWRRTDDGGVSRRTVTVFAAGTTLMAMLMTGLPSAYFPHIPTEYVAPLFEMMLPVMRDGFVPHNAGHLLDLQGTKSMFGFALAAMAIALIVLKGDEKRPLAALAHATGALAVLVFLLAPIAAAAKPESAAVTRYVRSAWEPSPLEVRPANVPPPPNETPAQARERARRLSENGEAAAALDAWLVALRGGRRATP